MGDRLYSDFSFSNHSLADYYEEEEETEGEYEDEEVNDEKSEELACPFCPEDFDVLGLCCHIDADHRMEVKPGICPFCATKVGINMASHVITQHENVLKGLCNKKHCRSRSRSTILLFRKELLEKHLRYIKESSFVGYPSVVGADSMLLSFVNNSQPVCRPQNESVSSTEASSARKNLKGESLDRIQPSLSTETKNGRTRCEFLQGMVLSTMFDDI